MWQWNGLGAGVHGRTGGIDSNADTSNFASVPATCDGVVAPVALEPCSPVVQNEQGPSGIVNKVAQKFQPHPKVLTLETINGTSFRTAILQIETSDRISSVYHIQETKVLQDEVGEATKLAARIGYHAFFSPAILTQKGGRSGGLRFWSGGISMHGWILDLCLCGLAGWSPSSFGLVR